MLIALIEDSTEIYFSVHRTCAIKSTCIRFYIAADKYWMTTKFKLAPKTKHLFWRICTFAILLVLGLCPRGWKSLCIKATATCQIKTNFCHFKQWIQHVRAENTGLPVFVSGLLESNISFSSGFLCSLLPACGAVRGHHIQSCARGSKLHLHTYLRVLPWLRRIFVVLNTQVSSSGWRHIHLDLNLTFYIEPSNHFNNKNRTSLQVHNKYFFI